MGRGPARRGKGLKICGHSHCLYTAGTIWLATSTFHGKGRTRPADVRVGEYACKNSKVE